MEQRTAWSRADWTILAASLVFLLLRTPSALLHGYLFAEEGTVYLRYAWDAPIMRALLAPHQSYYSLYPNVCGVIAARLLQPEAAALFFAWSALAIQLLLVVVLLRCELFTTTARKAAAVAVCLLTVPTINVALSTINAQFFLTLCTAVILMSAATRLRVFRGSVLVLAGLTGVTSCILTPFAIWFAIRERSRDRAVQAALLVACMIPQALVVLHMSHLQSRSLTPHSSLPFLLGAYLVNGPLFQFFTRWSGNVECRVLLSPRLSHWSGMLWAISEIAAVVGLALLAWIISRGGTAARKLGAMALFSLVIGLSGALPHNEQLMCDSGARYFFLGNVLLALALVVATASRSERRWSGRMVRPLIACVLVSGLADIVILWKHPPYIEDWRTQVAQWRQDPSRPIRIAPEAWPRVVLAPHHADADLPAYIYDSNYPDAVIK
jgi:hypothetical protein